MNAPRERFAIVVEGRLNDEPAHRAVALVSRVSVHPGAWNEKTVGPTPSGSWGEFPANVSVRFPYNVAGPLARRSS